MDGYIEISKSPVLGVFNVHDNRVHTGNPGLFLQLVGYMWNSACE